VLPLSNSVYTYRVGGKTNFEQMLNKVEKQSKYRDYYAVLLQIPFGVQWLPEGACRDQGNRLPFSQVHVVNRMNI